MLLLFIVSTLLPLGRYWKLHRHGPTVVLSSSSSNSIPMQLLLRYDVATLEGDLWREVALLLVERSNRRFEGPDSLLIIFRRPLRALRVFNCMTQVFALGASDSINQLCLWWVSIRYHPKWNFSFLRPTLIVWYTLQSFIAIILGGKVRLVRLHWLRRVVHLN